MFYTKPSGIQQLSHPLLNNVNGLYLFNDYQSGSVMDYSGKGNHFEFPSSNRPSWNGEGVEFNDDYERVDTVTHGKNIIKPSGTIALKYRWTTSQLYYYMVSPTSGFNEFSFLFYPDDSIDVYFSQVLKTSGLEYSTILDGDEHIIVLSWSPTKLIIVIDYNEVTDLTGTYTLPNDSYLETIGFGGRRDNTERSSGGVISWAVFLDCYLNYNSIITMIDESFAYEFFKTNNSYGYVSVISSIEGIIDGAVGPANGSVIGQQTREGIIDGLVGPANGSIIGQQTREGIVDGAVGPANGSIIGESTNLGIIDGLVGPANGSMTGQQTREGIIDGAVGPANGSIIGLVQADVEGIIDGLVGPANGSVIGQQTREGIIDGLVGPANGSIIGFIGNYGSMSGAVGPANGSMTGQQTREGVIEGAVGPANGSIIGELTNLGIVSGLVGPANGSMIGFVQSDVEGIISGLVGPANGSMIGFTPVEFNEGVIGGSVGPARGYLYERRDSMADFGFKTHEIVISSTFNMLYPQLVFPIINMNKNDVANGIIIIKDNLIAAINTIDLYVYESIPITVNGVSYWTTTSQNLRTPDIFRAEGYIESYKQKIKWRFDPTALPYNSVSLYYGLFVKVNKVDDAAIGQAYIEIIIKILNNQIA
jgi:hypothetical protein